MPRINQRDPYATERAVPFTNKEMQAMTGVSLMSLHLWRQGTPTKSPMPARKNDNGTVVYPVRSTMRWLKRHDIPLEVHPDDIDAMTKADRRLRRKKSGPTRAKVVDRRPVAYRH
jgi:hypothetical protein